MYSPVDGRGTGGTKPKPKSKPEPRRWTYKERGEKLITFRQYMFKQKQN